VSAYMWWNLAAAQGNSDAKASRDAIQGKMTPEQVAEGQRRAASFTQESE